MLREIDRNLWVSEHPFKYFGLNVGTRMTVIRFRDRELAIVSPIQANPDLVRQLNELGEVTHIVAPNLYHYLFLSSFKAAYPQATVWAAPGLAEKQPELSIDRELKVDKSSFLPGIESLFFEGFETLDFTGSHALNECVFFHSESRTLVLTDAAFHFDETSPWTTKLITRVLGGYQQLRPSLLERIATRDKEKVKQSVQNILLWDFDRVIVAHGSIVEWSGKERFQQGYQDF
ncbi:MAG: DUF4336 domain-containing protein [Cyanobacteriota bacterium]|nr:DUF4336 domain-containing protein [Cyanobacteriota bacterium]